MRGRLRRHDHDGHHERQASLFVGTLPFSTYLYAEATWTQASEDWLASHVRMFAAWGGTVPKLVPDNLKTGDPVLVPLQSWDKR